MLDSLDIDTTSTKTHLTVEGPIKKLLKHHSGDDYILELDNTSLESFLGCDRASEYRLVFSRSTYPSAALVYGGAIHKALESIYKGGSVDEALQSGSTKLLEAQTIYPNEWRNIEAFTRAITGYLKQYPDEPFEVYNNHVEQPFSEHIGEIILDCEIPYEPNGIVQDFDNVSLTYPLDLEKNKYKLYVRKLYIVWTGIIDLIVTQQSSLWVVDHKTTSMEGESFYKQFELSQQFIGYARTAGKILDTEIQGCLLNAIIGRKPTKTGKGLEFARRYYPYSQTQMSEWQDDILELIKDFIHRLSSGFFPKRTMHCTNKYGTCPYHNVCTLPQNQRMIMLHSDAYAPNVWNPLT